MISAIVFDCFGVLSTDIWLEFCESLPPDSDFSQLSSLNRAFDRSIIDEETFVMQVKELTGKTPPLLEQMSSMTKNTQLLELIATLKKTHKIGLLSNISSDWITADFLTDTEAELFDTMVLSYEVGMTKPDPRIYTLACERLRVAPNEALMIDDREQYVDGALAIGMSGVQYRSFDQFKKDLNELLNTNY